LSNRADALRATLGVEPREWNRLTAGVDAFHQIVVRHPLRLAAQLDERLDPRRAPRPSGLSDLSMGLASFRVLLRSFLFLSLVVLGLDELGPLGLLGAVLHA
jgi:hypothetical protein